MRTAPRRITLVLLLAATSGCMGMQATYATPAAANAAAAAMVGIWRVTAVNGQPLPAPSPMEPNVTVERSSLMLRENHEYSLSITGRRGTEAAQEVSQAGRWSAAGNTLTLSAETGRATRFTFTLTNTQLMLHDNSVTYTLVRG